MSLSIAAVIPTKNRRDMALRAVRSALSQTRPPDEIIVVDDASDDGTADAVAALGTEAVRCVACAGTGAADARNTGALAAKSDYVAFLDSDDEWLPKKLERQETLLAAETAVVFSDALVEPAEPDGRRTVFSRQPPRAGDIFEALLLDNFIPTSTAILPKTIFDGGLRFRGEYSPAEDYDFWLRAARRGTARFCPEPLAVYHRHPGQWGADLGVMFPSCARVVEDALRDAHRTVAAVPGARRRLWQLHFVAARAMAAAGRWQDAADALVRAAALRPFDWRSVVFLLRARACAGRLSARL